jgi:glycosyltransferase involved in cell wall biosynthesis
MLKSGSMRILLVANGYPPAANGGVETYTYHLANSLSSRCHPVSVLCRASAFEQPDFSIRREEVLGIPVIRVVNDAKEVLEFRNTYQSKRVEEIFIRVLVDFSPELIHFNHLIGFSSRLPLIAAARGIRTVFTLHDFWPFCARINLVDWLGRQCGGPENGGDCFTCLSGGQPQWQSQFLRQVKRSMPFRFRQALRRNLLMRGSKLNLIKRKPDDFPARQKAFREAVLIAREVLAPSDFVRKIYVANGYPAERIRVVPLGIDRPTIEPSLLVKEAGDEGTFAFIGNLTPAKGLDLLLRAFHQLESSTARLLIYGDESTAPPEYLRMLNDIAHGDSRLQFLGSFSQAQRTRVYQNLDVLVIPSRVPETFSLVAREALVHHRPVIAAENGALSELIRTGVNGFFFKPGDEISLLERLEMIMLRPEILSQMSCPGPVHIPFIDQHIEIIEGIYHQALAG